MDPQAHDGWRVGDIVDDLYEVRELATSGGMGLVHRVWHRRWNLELAVKTPRPQLVSSPQQMADFEAEAETWVGLGLHPHAVACVYVRRLGGVPRVFAEWVDGGSLAEAIESGRLYEGNHDEVLSRIMDVAIQLAWGLDHAHRRGLVHQDVKPANVMLTTDWTAKVSDFGLAKARAAAGEVAPSGPRVSVLAAYGGLTPAYCSPEQARAAYAAKGGQSPEPLTRATDVWSWAISVWEMFVGESPCRRGQVAGEAFQSFLDDPWGADPGVPAMPDDIAGLLTRCFVPAVATRPRDMGALADELVALHERLVGKPHARTKPEAAQLLPDALNNQALSLLDLGRHVEAGNLWRQALIADPNHLHSIYNRGLYRWRRGEITDSKLVAELESMRAAQPGALADQHLALVHLERRDTVSARRLLTDAAREAPHDRGIGDALAAAQHQTHLGEPRPLTEPHVHNRFRTVSVSADGRIMVADDDGAIQVWDLVAGTCLRELDASHVSAVTIAAGGRFAISAGRDVVQVWDLVSGACVQTFGAQRSISRVAVSADGRIVVVSGGELVWIWDTGERRCLHTFDNPGNAVAVSADGRTAISGGSNLVVWDVSTGGCRHTLPGHTHMVYSVAVSADGRIAVSGSHDTTVRVWDLVDGSCLHTLAGHAEGVFSVALSADGRIAVSGSYDHTVRVWDIDGGSCLRTLTGHTGGVSSVALSADGTTAVSVSQRQLLVWEIPTARGHPAEWSYARPHSAQDLLAGAAIVDRAVLRTAGLLAVGDGAQAAAELSAARAVPGYRRDRRLVSQWRQLARLGTRAGLKDAWLQHTLAGHAASVVAAVSGDGRTVVSGGRDGELRVWDAGSGDCRYTMTSDGSEVASVSITADGRLAVSCGYGETIQVWDVAGGSCLRTLTGHTSPVNSIAVSGDGRIAVSGSFGKSVRVWDCASGACLSTLNGHTGRVRSVAVSADGRIAVSGSSDSTLRVWDLTAEVCLHTLSFHRNWVGSVTVSADGRTAVSATDGHERVRVWDIERGVCTRTFEDDNDSVTVAISADGLIVVTGGGLSDKKLRVWDAATKTCLHTLSGHVSGIRSVALSADATVAVTAGDDQTVRVWTLDWEYDFPGRADGTR